MSKQPLLGRFGTGATDIAELRMDGSTHAISTIEDEHHEVHKGNSFSFTYSLISDGDVSDHCAIAFKTPATAPYMHMIITVSSTGSSTFTFYEAAAVSVNPGANVAVYNRNRNSSTTSGVLSIETTPTANEMTTMTDTQFDGATITEGTVKLVEVSLGGGNGPRTLGGGTRGAREWVLDAGVIYLADMVDLSAAENIQTINLSWYEHTDLD